MFVHVAIDFYILTHHYLYIFNKKENSIKLTEFSIIIQLLFNYLADVIALLALDSLCFLAFSKPKT